ncbi:hypothetical protein cyc_00254 [Cyclospora cayetanensis]|uniref:Uncharacterized protein n=1 Tax=Cyclospora cayetanensis TaxID=88456 RepID=A0A1D3D9T7_9EIME|nr:hypothetical protein cyc_00254 [Cyclospora cayetanensis]
MDSEIGKSITCATAKTKFAEQHPDTALLRSTRSKSCKATTQCLGTSSSASASEDFFAGSFSSKVSSTGLGENKDKEVSPTSSQSFLVATKYDEIHSELETFHTSHPSDIRDKKTSSSLFKFPGGYYERKLRYYLLTTTGTAAAKLLIPWPEDEAAATLGLKKDSEEQQALPSRVHQADSDCSVAQQLHMPLERPIIPYCLVVKEVRNPIAFPGSRGLWQLCDPFRICQYMSHVVLPLLLKKRIMRKEKQEQMSRRSYLWEAKDEKLPQKSSSSSHTPTTEVRAFVRRLYNVPRRQLPADLNEWHRQCCNISEPAYRPQGCVGFAVYEKAIPSTATAAKICTKAASAINVLQISRPKVVVRISLPEIGVDISSSTRSAEGENPFIDQALSFDLSGVQCYDIARLYKQRGRIYISVFDEMRLPDSIACTRHNSLHQQDYKDTLREEPSILLGSLDLAWSSLLLSATETAVPSMESAAFANAIPRTYKQRNRLRKLFERRIHIAEDGTCCLCILNGCFRLQQPRGLLSHDRGVQKTSAASGGAVSPHSRAAHACVATPCDMFISLKIEIRGLALAIGCGFPRMLFPENLDTRLVQPGQQLLESVNFQRQPFHDKSDGHDIQALITLDMQWRQKAQRCGALAVPSSIVMDSLGSLRLLCDLLFPALPPESVAVPFEPYCLEKTAAFVSLLPCVDDSQVFKGKLEHFALSGHIVGEGERHLVLRLAQSGAAQLWDPLTGEAICISSNDDPQEQQQLQSQSLSKDENLSRRKLDVLLALQGITAQHNRLQQHLAFRLHAAQQYLSVQQCNIEQKLQCFMYQEKQLNGELSTASEGKTALEDVQQLQVALAELKTNENALISEWRTIHAAESNPSPFILGGPSQKSTNGLWPVSHLSLVVGRNNAYINLQPMRCLNSRHSSMSAPVVLRAHGQALNEFAPYSASPDILDDESLIRQSIRSRLRRQHRWRCLGLPALGHTLKRAAKSVASATLWRLRPKSKVVTLASCRFALQSPSEWAPLFTDVPDAILAFSHGILQIELENHRQQAATTAHERTFEAEARAGSPCRGAPDRCDEAGAVNSAEVMGIWGTEDPLVDLVPPTSHVSPFRKETHYEEADPPTLAEAEQHLQRALQQFLIEHYAEAYLASESKLGQEDLNGENLTYVQQLLFTAEPHEAVYELLESYEEARCTNSWQHIAANPQYEADTADKAVACLTSPTRTTEHMLQDTLRRLISSRFPGRPIRGIVHHFVEVDALKLATQLIDARVFDWRTTGRQSIKGTSGRGHSFADFQGPIKAQEFAMGCLVVRLFPYPCGLYSGWLFAGTID